MGVTGHPPGSEVPPVSTDTHRASRRSGVRRRGLPAAAEAARRTQDHPPLPRRRHHGHEQPDHRSTVRMDRGPACVNATGESAAGGDAWDVRPAHARAPALRRHQRPARRRIRRRYHHHPPLHPRSRRRSGRPGPHPRTGRQHSGQEGVRDPGRTRPTKRPAVLPASLTEAAGTSSPQASAPSTPSKPRSVHSANRPWPPSRPGASYTNSAAAPPASSKPYSPSTPPYRAERRKAPGAVSGKSR